MSYIEMNLLRKLNRLNKFQNNSIDLRTYKEFIILKRIANSYVIQ